MANRAVSIWKYVKVDGRWKYCPVVIAKNNSIKPNWVLVNGELQEHKEGNYYLHFREGRRQVWQKVGPKPTDATHAAQFADARLRSIAVGLPLAEPDQSSLSISGTLLPYLEDYKLSHREESYNLMDQTLKEFCEFCPKQAISSITRMDLLRCNG
jgi:hypothetical protein